MSLVDCPKREGDQPGGGNRKRKSASAIEKKLNTSTTTYTGTQMALPLGSSDPGYTGFYAPTSSRPNSPFPQPLPAAQYSENLRPRHFEGLPLATHSGPQSQLHSSTGLGPSSQPLSMTAFATSPEQLSELLKNHHYRNLWNENETLKHQVRQLTEEKTDLLQQVVYQQGEVNKLQKAQLCVKRSSGYVEPRSTLRPLKHSQVLIHY